MARWFRISRDGLMCPWWWTAGIWSYRTALYLWLISTGVLTVGSIMYADLETLTYAGAAVGAVAGALAYSASCYLGRYQEQRLKSARIEADAAAAGRELTDAERQQTSKTERFQAVYLAALILNSLIAAGAAFGLMMIFGSSVGLEADGWAEYGLIACVLGVVLAVILERYVATPIADGTYDKTKTRIYEGIVAAAKSAAESGRAQDALSGLSDEDRAILQLLKAIKSSKE